MPNGNDTHQQGFASATGNNMQQQHGLDPLGAPGHQQHGGFSQQQSQGCDEQGSQGSAQQDALTQQLHQVLIADMGRFWTTTVAPSTQAIAQVGGSLMCGAGQICIVDQNDWESPGKQVPKGMLMFPAT